MGSIVAIVQLIGAILFSIGSACFVWMAFVDDWVLPLRLGCGLWIGGCVPYTFLALRGEVLREDTGVAFHVANALQIGGMLGWAIGSAFAFLDDLDFGLQVTNGGFLAGSCCLFLDPLLQCRKFGSLERDEQISLSADLTAGVFYVLAGGFGGYAVDSMELMQFGNVCWLVGSLISGTRPILALCRPAAATKATDVEMRNGAV